MEFKLVFMGAQASGKTAAIRAVSEVEVVDTDVRASNEPEAVNVSTTVAMDVGAISLGDDARLRLYGTPGQKRFDFMWDIVLQQGDGVLLMVSHAAADPVTDLDFFWRQVKAREGVRRLPVAVCVSHADQNLNVPLSIYGDYFQRHHGMSGAEIPPIVSMDARESLQVRAALIAMTALLEMRERFERDPRGRSAGSAGALVH